MPWDCQACGVSIQSDDAVCPTCQGAKESWTLVAETTRTFQVTGSRLHVLRAHVTDPYPEGETEPEALQLEATEAFAVVPKASIARLAESGERPRATNVTVARLLPRKGKKQADFLLEVLYETEEIDEAPVEAELPPDLEAGGHVDVLL